MKKIYLMLPSLLLVMVAMAQRSKEKLVADSLLQAGRLYSNRQSPQYDINHAISCYEAAAARGRLAAMAALARITDDSTLACNDGAAAVRWWSTAGAKGYSAAWYALGNIYEKGRKDVPQDFGVSAGYFYKGMAAGDYPATGKVAYYLYKGLAGRQDYDSAFLLYSRVARATHQGTAMYFLGLCYRNGYGTVRRPDSALYWLAAAASRKEVQARQELAMTTPDNPVEAIALPHEVEQMIGGDLVAGGGLRAGRTGSLEGTYAGYVVRYDWSRKHVISLTPLRAVLHKQGDELTGSWQEADQTTPIQASYGGGDLQFKNTSYLKKWHYTLRTPAEPWQFTDAGLQLLQTNDSVYLTGDLSLYSPVRKEPASPMYVYLSRVATAADKDELRTESTVATWPNPFKDRVQVKFSVNGNQAVVISLVSMSGDVVSVQALGRYGAGTYTQWIDVPASVASGAYIVKVNTGTSGGNALVVKQ